MDFQQEILNDTMLTWRYQFVCKIGEGCFGKIYKVKNKELKIQTALKIQITDNRSKKSMLEKQAQILKKLKGKPFVPNFYFFGQWNHGTFIQIQLLVRDLNSLSQKTFSIEEITSMTVKLLQSLSILHNNQILHQDIKPQNIMINHKGQYVFIDFGISKKLKQGNRAQKDARKTKGFIGTPRYASIQAHKSLQQSKKDDLQSLMYNIAFLYFKKLPWLSLKVSGSRKIQQIKNIKIKTVEGVFQRMGRTFANAFNYIKKMEHMQEPNYKNLLSIFKRSHSVIVDPVKKFSAQSIKQYQSRKQIKIKQGKKLSLNLNHSNSQYLALPSFMKKSKFSQIDEINSEYTGHNSGNNQEKSSMGASKANSIQVHYENDNEQHTNDDQIFQKDMRIDEENSKQPSVPHIYKFLNSLKLKNPFNIS